MNTLLLDIHDDTVIEAIRDLHKTDMVFGSIDDQSIDTLPDLIIVDFDVIFETNEREMTFTEITSKAHRHEIVVVALSKEWNDGLKSHARRFGADECLGYEDLATIRTVVHIIEASNKLRQNKA